jgi:elongation factor 1-alpha
MLKTNPKEITITILGNANSGKSTLTGILTNPYLENLELEQLNSEDLISFMKNVLDNGNGKVRNKVLHFNHEIETGRTSSITHKYLYLKNLNKIINIIDLAGHEKYIKTTINGINISLPDYGILCIEKNITKITLEHLKLLHIYNIPFCILFTKTDLIPEDKIKYNMKKIIRKIKKLNNNHLIVKKQSDTNFVKYSNIVPISFLSNKTGFGYKNLLNMINNIEQIKYDNTDKTYFYITHKYKVQGFGLVVTGISYLHIKKGDFMLLGFFNKKTKKTYKIKVKTLHDDYKNFVNEIIPGQKSCICFSFVKESLDYKYIRSGLVITKPEYINDKIKPTTTFTAEIIVFDKTSCTITKGYSAYMNMGAIKETIIFKNILNTRNDKNLGRAGDILKVEVEFLKNPYCVFKDEKFIFREGNTIGYGVVI